MKCSRIAHPGKSCEEARLEETDPEFSLAGLGIFVQACPFCRRSGDKAPGDCMHITCACKEQFCFVCAAPHTPTVAHSAAYHRPQCGLFTVCCGKKCIEGGAAVCVLDVYRPGPCAACKNHPTKHNTCTHSPWRACSDCVKIHKKACPHWCRECEKTGKLCAPPDNPLVAAAEGEEQRRQYIIISHDAVKSAEAEEKGETEKKK